MTLRIPRRHLIVVTAFLLILPAEGLLIPALLQGRIDDASASSWVAAHAQSLPTSMIDIKAFPMIYRKRIMKALPPETQASLWRSHLEEYLQNHPEMDQARVALVQTAIGLCVPGMFITPKADDVQEVQRIVMTDIGALFSRSEAVEIFAQFGAETRVASHFEAMKLQIAAWLQKKLAPTVRADAEDCNCYIGFWDWCTNCPTCPTRHCDEGSGCHPVSGCGFMWTEMCYGTCKIFEGGE